MPAWLGPAIKAGGGIIGALLGKGGDDGDISKQIRAAKKAQLRELDFAKNESDRAFDLATATRTDGLGNTTSYNEKTGFTTTLSPIIAQLLSQSQGLQTRDMTTGRDMADSATQRADQRARRADTQYNRIMDELAKRRFVSEDELIADQILENLDIYNSRNNMRGNPIAENIARRDKSGEAIRNSFRREYEVVPTIAEILASARSGGRTRFAQAQDDNNPLYAILAQLDQQARGYPVRINDVVNTGSDDTNSFANSIINTMQQGSNRIANTMASGNNALMRLRASRGGGGDEGPDYKTIISALTGFLGESGLLDEKPEDYNNMPTVTGPRPRPYGY